MNNEKFTPIYLNLVKVLNTIIVDDILLSNIDDIQNKYQLF